MYYVCMYYYVGVCVYVCMYVCMYVCVMSCHVTCLEAIERQDNYVTTSVRPSVQSPSTYFSCCLFLFITPFLLFYSLFSLPVI